MNEKCKEKYLRNQLMEGSIDRSSWRVPFSAPTENKENFSE